MANNVEYVILAGGERRKVTESTIVDWDDGDTLVHLWYEDPCDEEDD